MEDGAYHASSEEEASAGSHVVEAVAGSTSPVMTRGRSGAGVTTRRAAASSPQPGGVLAPPMAPHQMPVTAGAGAGYSVGRMVPRATSHRKKPKPRLLPGHEGRTTQSDLTAVLGEEHYDVPSVLEMFWDLELSKIHAFPAGKDVDFKGAVDLPLARIKRIMKSDEDVRMISAEAPILFAKACEMFILDMSLRAWANSKAERGKRRTLNREELLETVQNTDFLDFLVPIMFPDYGEEDAE